MGGRGCGTPSKQTARRHGGRARRPSACILVASLARLPPARDGEPTMLMQYLPYDTHSTPAAQPASRAAGASAGGDQKVQSVWCLSLSPSLTASSLSLRLCRPCLSLAVCWCLLSCTAAPPTQTHRLPMNEEIKFIVAHLFAVCTDCSYGDTRRHVVRGMSCFWESPQGLLFLSWGRPSLRHIGTSS